MWKFSYILTMFESILEKKFYANLPRKQSNIFGIMETYIGRPNYCLSKIGILLSQSTWSIPGGNQIIGNWLNCAEMNLVPSVSSKVNLREWPSKITPKQIIWCCPDKLDFFTLCQIVFSGLKFFIKFFMSSNCNNSIDG